MVYSCTASLLLIGLILEKQKRIEYLLQYFVNWYNCRNLRKVDSDPNVSKIWEKTVITEITYTVMLLSVMGFHDYCAYMFEKYCHILYIPALHSNQSSIESHFSLMRFHGADNPERYESMFNVVDNEKSMLRMTNNPMYEHHEEKYVV